MGSSGNRIVVLFMIVLLFGLAAAAGFSGCGPSSSTETNQGNSFQARELSSGQTISFPQAYAGKKVALVFFSIG